MYQRCIFCASDLGKNGELEFFPTGRRLAFDSAKGRLWVVCGQCANWNLTPLEQRWEAIEEAESQYRNSPLRASTPEIGLARLPGGLELIRIGKPLRPEFAAWRYGGRFRRRQVEYLAMTGALATGLVGFGLGSPVLASTALVAGLLTGAKHLSSRVVGHSPVGVPRREGSSLAIRTANLGDPRLVPGDTPGSWQLRLQHTEGMATLAGEEAVQALGLILPRMNWVGASRRTIREAVSDLVVAGSPAEYFGVVTRRHRDLGGVFVFPRVVRAALEMAANEDAERHAMNEDLALLEQAWREAEAIATVADSLFLPRSVQRAYNRLKGS